MPYPPLKNETYRCQGGINQKISLYIGNPGDFLALQNVDFRVVGALSSFAGSTNFTSQSATSPITGLASYYNSTSLTVVSTDSYNVASITGSTYAGLFPYLFLGNTNATSFAQAQALYGCNGQDFWTYQGSSLALPFSLGKPVLASNRVFGSTSSGGGAGLASLIVMYYSLVRQDGFIGPALAVTYGAAGATAVSFNLPLGPNLNIGLSSLGFSLASFGLSGIQVWAQLNNLLPVGLTPLIGMTTGGNPGVTLPYNFTALPAWGLVTPQPYDFQGSFYYGTGSTQGSDGAGYGYGGVSIFNNNSRVGFVPSLCEFYANQLFVAGVGPPAFIPYSNNNNAGINVSRVFYSNPGIPEQFDYSNFFDVGLQDPTGVTALKAFFTQLMIFKQNTTWSLSGTGPDTFVLSQISSINGCISQRSVCVWNTLCWFLDKKGIYQFDGANLTCVSDKMEPYFKRMNIAAAESQAVIIHVKDRNEVWCAIPIDGATYNNLILVFDYVSGGWTTATVPPGNLTALSSVIMGNTSTTVFFGNNTGMIGTYGSSLVGDNGVGKTLQIKSHFIQDLGNTVTKMFRRLYIDATVPAGVTFPIAVNIYADKSTVPYLSTTMLLTAYQNRIDFGVPAKSIAVEFLYNGATFFQMSGFTIESRFQRAT